MITSNGTITDLGNGLYKITTTGFATNNTMANIYFIYNKGDERGFSIKIKAVLNSVEYDYPIVAPDRYERNGKGILIFNIPPTADELVYYVQFIYNHHAISNPSLGSLDLQFKYL